MRMLGNNLKTIRMAGLMGLCRAIYIKHDLQLWAQGFITEAREADKIIVHTVMSRAEKFIRACGAGGFHNGKFERIQSGDMDDTVGQ